MSEEATKNTAPQSIEEFALELAKSTGFGTDEAKFKEWEKGLIKKIYEIIGLADIPEEFLTISKFIEAYSGVLMKSVQNDLAVMNLTKRLSMFKLSETIAQTADAPAKGSEANEGKPAFVPPTEK